MNTQLAQIDIGDTYGSPWGNEFGYNLGYLIGFFLSAVGVIAGVILIFLLIGGGLKIISGAGNNDPKSAAQGQQAITWALIGFVILFGAYWIIRVIELMIGADIITNPVAAFM